MKVTRDGFCRKLLEDMDERSGQGGIGPERMADEFVRAFGVSLRPAMAELKELLREAGFGEVSEAGHLPGGMRGVHYTAPDGSYDIHYLSGQPEGATVHTVLHETYEIIHETLCDLHAGTPPPRTVCIEANRFAAACCNRRPSPCSHGRPGSTQWPCRSSTAAPTPRRPCAWPR